MNLTKPDREGKTNIKEYFLNPPYGYGIVPFYWWIGDKLTKERIEWQLDKMKDHSITGYQINYAHDCSGGISWGATYESDPKLFSAQWWDLFHWLVEKGKKENFSVSLSDYTLGTAGQGWFIDDILKDSPNLRANILKAVTKEISIDEKIYEIIPQNTLNVCIISKESNQVFDLMSLIYNGVLNYTATFKGILSIVYSEKQEYSLDPMHELSGLEVCEKFFDKFEENNPGEAGNGLNFFFSDELNFGVRGMLWNGSFAKEFINRKGYDVLPCLSALFIDIGDMTPKIRLDYYDVIVQLEEKYYFKPVFDWHESRGMIYGCDHGGRGHDVTEFGDYFRTQKYNQGPGCDQPSLQSDIIKNKVACSIAHLYERPRVWLEGFYGSGWGTSSGQLADAIARNFTMGHNLLSLHGMYYTTRGGWWEWAPPCNTFRMPYWDDAKILMKATERLSYLMSQGVHCCDVAIIYPVASMEGSINDSSGEASVEMAFDAAISLYKNGIDFDFIDFESIIKSKIQDKKLKIAGENYQILIIPSMKTVRFEMIEKILAFKKAGGIVINLGDLPECSDNKGRHDNELNSIICEIFLTEDIINDENKYKFKETNDFENKNKIHNNGIILQNIDDLVKIVRNIITPDFFTEFNLDDTYVNHRRFGDMDYYMVYGIPKGTECFFRAKGKISIWNPYDGKAYSMDDYTETNEGTTLKLPLTEKDFQIIVFDKKSDVESYENISRMVLDFNAASEILELSSVWDFELNPCLDNKYGDYFLPASNEIIGAQARKFEYYESNDNNICNNTNKKVTYSYGPYFLQKGPFKNEEDYLKTIEYANQKNLDGFIEYDFSMRYGVENDPGLQGYHGLKSKVTDDFLTIGEKTITMTGTNYTDYDDAFGKVFYTNVLSEKDDMAIILTGEIKPDSLYINGHMIEDYSDSIQIKAGYNRIVAGYKKSGRTHLVFAKNSTQIQDFPLAMSWYKKSDMFSYDCYAGIDKEYGNFRFMSPPALNSIEIFANAEMKVSIGGIDADLISKSAESCVYSTKKIDCYSTEVIIQVKYRRGVYGGAVFDKPINMKCGKGKIELGDWSRIDGLRCYSGGATYQTSINISDEQKTKKVWLSFEKIISSATLFINSKFVESKVSPDWNFDISNFVNIGDNTVELKVFNTLSNHYDTIPTRYRGDLASGIFGNAKLYFFDID